MATTIVAFTDMLDTRSYTMESVESAWISLGGHR
jgi:hypothetical protein